MTEATGSSEN